MNNELFNTGSCAICGRWIAAYGHYNHSMMHVRRGEAECRSDWRKMLYSLPYSFTLTDKGRALADERKAVRP